MKEKLKGIWRLLQPFKTYGFKYPIEIWNAYARFFKNWKQYKSRGGKFSFRYIYPILYIKKEDAQSGGGQYFYQDIWALKKLSQLKPLMHYDIGSRFDGFTGQATAICPVTCIDIRPPSFSLPGLSFLQGDILRLPFENNSLQTLSSLHTIEHIGLGRYGDDINPDGFKLALLELQRVIAPKGFLILSMPIGAERIEFNAQRVLAPETCIHLLNNMDLVEFSVVNDQHQFCEQTDPARYADAKYSCGLYLFKKK